MSNEGDWKNKIPYPYKGLNDPKYIIAREKLFKGQNGWWWGRGWWSDVQKESPLEYSRRKRRERGE
jgi:hypothetical protein